MGVKVSLKDLELLDLYWFVMYGVWGLFLVTSIVANGILIWAYYVARYKVPAVSPEREPEGLWIVPIHTHHAPTPRKDLN